MKQEIGHLNTKPGNWLFSNWADLLILFAPVWILWGVFFSNSAYFVGQEMPIWAWVLFIVGLDVSHVWSSLFRTYLDKEEFATHKVLLILTPILVILISVLLISFSIEWFWRIMAYLAVFHFIKQQYGFVALYKMKAGENRKQLLSDKWVIYFATIYPVVFWHFNSTAQFNWFVQHDFFELHSLAKNQAFIQQLFSIGNWVYWMVIGTWVFLEIRARIKGNIISTGKILWVLTTAVNWWFGIVYYNSDVIFSISNVVAHGIPYMALIYFYGLKKKELKTGFSQKVSWKFKWIIILIATIFIAAIVEEYFWDMLVYREHDVFFEQIYPYNWDQLTNHWAVIIAIAILAMPQQVHYIVDGFIWKMNDKNPYLKPIFKPKKNES